MCGLAGFLRNPGTPDPTAQNGWLEAMGQALFHRGPDAGGTYLDDHAGLVHRRLSILDLTEAGNQPMMSCSGRYVIVFNGEIYNYRILKQALVEQGHTFHTQTDTEVLLRLFEEKGIESLQDLNGMFAAAIWDCEEKKLWLFRDRLGKKPVYYYSHNGEFAFASEIKAFHALPFFKASIRPDAIKDFFFYQYIPDPKSIYREVHKLPPGHWLMTDGQSTKIEQYWDLSFSKTLTGSEEELEAGLREKLTDAVSLRMISDVPLGAFLSGGVDSSAVVGLMAGQSSRPITTCAIGFDSEKFDEVHYARQVSELFKTDHHEFTVRETVADNLLPIARFFDEPFADPSFVPTYFVSQLARQQVTVALAGDGGDEGFAGYSKYLTDAVENQLRQRIPGFIRRGLFPSLAQLARQLPLRPARRAGSLLDALALDPADGFYVSNRFCHPAVWNRLVRDDLALQTHDYDPADITRDYYHQTDSEDHLARILYADFKTYLPGDILVKVDRMSMANSLETRAPLLDYRVVEYAASLPSNLKLRGREKKYILKKAFEDMLPHEILYRRKMGFSVPLAQWLRSEVKPLAQRLLMTESGGLGEFFKLDEVKALWDVHQRGDNRFTQELWTLLAFALWRHAYPH